MDDLDCHLATEPAIASSIDACHPAMTDLLHELVFGELRQPCQPYCGLHHSDGELYAARGEGETRTKLRCSVGFFRSQTRLYEQLVVVLTKGALFGPGGGARQQKRDV